jgi:mRNA interferase MazF
MSDRTFTPSPMGNRRMKPGDIFLGQFPFGDAPGMKLRLVLVLSRVTGAFAEVLVAYISSVFPSDQLATDLLIDPEAAADRDTNLKMPSVLRLHKLATVHRSSLVRFLGRLSPSRFAAAQVSLREWLAL